MLQVILKFSLPALISIFFSFNANAPQNSTFASNDIVGEWIKDDNAFKVSIYAIGEKFYGKILWLEQPLGKDGLPKRDELNPDASLRKIPIIGLTVMKSLEFDGDNMWDNGSLYDLESGKTYDCKVSLVNKDRAELRAFLTFSFLGKSFFFNRVK